MPEYHVTWEIDLTADSPREAAEQALAIQRDPNSTATVFDVVDEDGNAERVDLEEPREPARTQFASIDRKFQVKKENA